MSPANKPKPVEALQLSEFLYTTISEDILRRTGQCVLILGPELSINENGVGYKKRFREIVEDNTNNSQYLHKDNLFHFNDDIDQRLVLSQIKDFYKKVGDPMLLEMISRIPFSLIINVCPDEALNNVYRKKGYDFKDAYFSATNVNLKPEVDVPTKECPLIYNIFGTIEFPQSLIFDHNKLYQTIAQLLPPLSLPRNLEEYLLNTANSFVFLGFNFDSWYYQLVCHKLGLAPKVNVCTPKIEEDDHVSILMKKTFSMDFTPDTPAQFIHELLVRCESQLRPADEHGRYSAFISYAWNGNDQPDRALIVDLIERSFKNKLPDTFKLFRDRSDLHYGDSIDSFMHMIGTGKTVFLIVSDKYLKSRYCMMEALRVNNYNDPEKRVFLVLLEDAARVINADNLSYNPESTYAAFWKTKCERLLKKNGLEDKKKLLQAIEIFNFVDTFIELITGRMNFSLNYRDISTNTAGELLITETKKEHYDLFVEEVITKLTAK